MVPNPCICGCSLQSGTRIVAIIDLVLTGITAALSILLLVVSIILYADKEDQFSDNEVMIIIILVIIVILSVIAQFILAILLLSGANNRQFSKCRLWFIFNSIFLVLTIITFILSIFSGTSTVLTGTLVSIVYKLFAVWVVYAFMDELKMDAKRQQQATENQYNMQHIIT